MKLPSVFSRKPKASAKDASPSAPPSPPGEVVGGRTRVLPEGGVSLVHLQTPTPMNRQLTRQNTAGHKSGAERRLTRQLTRAKQEAVRNEVAAIKSEEVNKLVMNMRVNVGQMRLSTEYMV